MVKKEQIKRILAIFLLSSFYSYVVVVPEKKLRIVSSGVSIVTPSTICYCEPLLSRGERGTFELRVPYNTGINS